MAAAMAVGGFLRDWRCRRSRRERWSGHGPCAQGVDGCDIGGTGTNSIALVAQSVGGGGGVGGDATGLAIGSRVAIGGNGGLGGNGGPVTLNLARACSPRPTRSAAQASWRRASAVPAARAAARP